MKELRKFRNDILEEREGREEKPVKEGEEEEEGDEGWMSHDLKFHGQFFLSDFFFSLFFFFSFFSFFSKCPFLTFTHP